LQHELDDLASSGDIFGVSTESIGGLEGRRSAWEHPFLPIVMFPAKITLSPAGSLMSFAAVTVFI